MSDVHFGYSVYLGLKKKLFDWRNPTDPIFTADPKYYFFVCKKKFKNPVKQIFSFSIAIWYEYEDIQNDK